MGKLKNTDYLNQTPIISTTYQSNILDGLRY